MAEANAPAHGRIEYLQLPAVDLERSAAFYDGVFGWSVDRSSGSFEAPGIIGQLITEAAPATTGVPVCGSQPTASPACLAASRPTAAKCVAVRNSTGVSGGWPRSTTPPATASALWYRLVQLNPRP